jgi:membrane fusion protein (multidrug efflux system)
MLKRMILMLAVMLGIIGALGFFKYQQIQTAMAQGAAFQPPPEAVTTIVARQDEWPATLSAIGTMAAVQGVTVSADLPGIVDKLSFDSGRAVRRGDILAELDTRQERAQLAAIEAQRDLARLNYERMKGLLSDRVVSQAEFDRAAAEQRQTDAQVGEIRATIDRKTIRAPFSGLLGIRQVNLGQYLAAGDPLGPLQSLHPIYVNFGVPQQDVGRLRIGHGVRITMVETAPGTAPGAGAPASAGVATSAASTADIDAAFDGRVTAIEPIVEQATRNVQVQATLNNPQGRLRPGMFVQTELSLGASRAVVALPASAISYAPFGDSVFIVSDLRGDDGKSYRGVRQQFVKLGGARGDQVAIISGVKPGEEIVTSGVFKLRNGAAVVVNNKAQPANQRAPKPEDS